MESPAVARLETYGARSLLSSRLTQLCVEPDADGARKGSFLNPLLSRIRFQESGHSLGIPDSPERVCRVRCIAHLALSRIVVVRPAGEWVAREIVLHRHRSGDASHRALLPLCRIRGRRVLRWGSGASPTISNCSGATDLEIIGGGLCIAAGLMFAVSFVPYDSPRVR